MVKTSSVWVFLSAKSIWTQISANKCGHFLSLIMLRSFYFSDKIPESSANWQRSVSSGTSLFLDDKYSKAWILEVFFFSERSHVLGHSAETGRPWVTVQTVAPLLLRALSMAHPVIYWSTGNPVAWLLISVLAAVEVLLVLVRPRSLVKSCLRCPWSRISTDLALLAGPLHCSAFEQLAYQQCKQWPRAPFGLLYLESKVQAFILSGPSKSLSLHCWIMSLKISTKCVDRCICFVFTCTRLKTQQRKSTSNFPHRFASLVWKLFFFF